MTVEKINGRNYLTINNETKTIPQWAKEKGIDYKTLYNRIFLSHWDEDKIFEPAVSLPTHSFDEHYFDIIDDEHKAYWLGFIYADGYLNSKNPTVGIELKYTDIDHLNKFKSDLKSNLEVKIYNKNSTFGPQTNCRFVFNNTITYNALISHGITPTKSLDGQFPVVDDNQFIKDIIRGIFDGDGSLSYRVGSNGFLTSNISICGTKEVLQAIEEYSGFGWVWTQRYPERNINNWQIHTGKQNDILNFLNNIYQGATIYLDRKYQRYCDIVESRKVLINNKVPKYGFGNRKNKSSGTVGVTWDSQRGKWHAYISINKNSKHLGFFDDINDAIAARKMAEDEIINHKNQELFVTCSTDRGDVSEI